ncbi:histone H4 [Aspergillus mulundensis]|uniref:Histone H4 n=1 Tax=Aspergillus mulundensis TaxID=1810919 RepID=A0A3D8QMT0_9EURO|nr:hypothetical protein DSM5745_10061 [Aspergillus mulundensis]RDW62950.1 hypothetical protein DSM5745_10061 [Aspergillus mulundensis]
MPPFASNNPKPTGLRGLGVVKGRRHKIVRDNIMGVTRPAIRRLARRGGVYRISAEIYEETRIVLKKRLTETIRQVILIMDSGTIPSNERKLVTTRDVSSMNFHIPFPYYVFKS